MTELSLQEAWQAAPIETELRNLRDYGPEGITASTAMGAANLLDAVRAANAPRLTVRAAFVAGFIGHLNIDTGATPEEPEV